MESNFNFLSNEWKIIFERARRAEESAFPDIRASYVFARMTLELTVKLVYEKDSDLDISRVITRNHGGNKHSASLNDLIKHLNFENKLGYLLEYKILEIKAEGNNAVHNKKLKYTNPIIILKNLFEFTKWFSLNYSDNGEELRASFDEALLSKKKTNELSLEELNTLEKKLRLENQLEIEKFQKKIQQLEKEVVSHLNKINKQEEELIGLQKLLAESKVIIAVYSNLQAKDKKNENYYSFQIQEIGITEQSGLIWGRVFVNFVFNNKQYFAVKYFAPNNLGRVEESKLVAKGKYQESKMYTLFKTHHNNLNFREILNQRYDHLELVKKYDKKRFGTPSILLEKLLLDLKKQFAFQHGDKEYIENGYYRIENSDYMSIWAFKNNYESKSENTTEKNYSDANKLLAQKIPFFKSKPDYGYFKEIKIYPLVELKLFYETDIKTIK